MAAAISVLKQYYEGAFLQVATKTGAATNAAAAQTTTKSGLRMKDASTIIGVLEVAESDFTKLLAESETAEETAAQAFKKLAQEAKVSKAAKMAEVKGKESEIKTLSVQVENYKEDRSSVQEELDAVLTYLDKLKPQCEVKAMSYEEKVAKREAEIEGLKEALGIMEGQDIPALVQVKAHLRR